MARSVYLGRIIIDPSVAYKITHRANGGCTPGEVQEAFLQRADVDLAQRDDGSVAGFGTTYAGVRPFAAFHPRDVQDDLWALKSAWPV